MHIMYRCTSCIDAHHVYMHIMYTCTSCIHAHHVYMHIMYTCTSCTYTCTSCLHAHHVYMHIMYTCISCLHVQHVQHVHRRFAGTRTGSAIFYSLQNIFYPNGNVVSLLLWVLNVLHSLLGWIHKPRARHKLERYR
jgi:hypothetical protein